MGYWFGGKRARNSFGEVTAQRVNSRALPDQVEGEGGKRKRTHCAAGEIVDKGKTRPCDGALNFSQRRQQVSQ